jgi:hypothetical protein
MSRLILYYTEHCHLCDDAEALMHAVGLKESYEKMDIDDDPELLEHYEIHIPVLKRLSDQQELFWPFNQRELEVFIDQQTCSVAKS